MSSSTGIQAISGLHTVVLVIALLAFFPSCIKPVPLVNEAPVGCASSVVELIEHA